MRRTWIKLYVDQILRGSCFDELLPDERFVWFGFLLLAGDNACEGEISITKTMGYTKNQLAELLKCEVELIGRSVKKMIKVDKINVLEGGIIKIINWQRYQSEYQRLRKYKKSTKKGTKKSTAKSIIVDIDRDIEGDIDKKEKKIKKEKEKKIKYLDFVFLTQKEYDKLIIKLGKAKTEDMIEKLNNYIGQIGIKKANQKYTSHYHTILNWIRREKENNGRAKTEGQDWDKLKEKRDDYKWKPIPQKTEEEVDKILKGKIIRHNKLKEGDDNND